MTLAELLETRPDKEPIAPFPALLESRPATVTAVLERTAIVDDGSGRRAVRLDRLSVDPELVQWKSDQGGRFSENGAPFVRGKAAFSRVQTAPKTEAQREETRRLGDERALKSQAAKPVVMVRVKRQPNRSLESKQRAKLVAQQRRREGEPKLCRACGQIKPRSAFPVLRGSPSCFECRDRTHCPKGHEMSPENTILRKRWRMCRTCHNEQQGGYRKLNPDPRQKRDRRAYYLANRERIAERQRRWYQRKKQAA